MGSIFFCLSEQPCLLPGPVNSQARHPHVQPKEANQIWRQNRELSRREKKGRPGRKGSGDGDTALQQEYNRHPERCCQVMRYPIIPVFEGKAGGPHIPGQPWLQSKNPSQKLKSKQHKYERDAYRTRMSSLTVAAGLTPGGWAPQQLG